MAGAHEAMEHHEHAEHAAHEQARYYCPMHPEVRSPDPGQCPICHMNLEPIPEERRSSPGPAAPPSAANAPRPIIVTLQEDGTIAGEMMTASGPVKWTGEKLRAKKKG